jgi:hypothetical protein
MMTYATPVWAFNSKQKGGFYKMSKTERSDSLEDMIGLYVLTKCIRI